MPLLTLPCKPLQAGLQVLSCFVSVHVLHTCCVPETLVSSEKASSSKTQPGECKIHLEHWEGEVWGALRAWDREVR